MLKSLDWTKRRSNADGKNWQTLWPPGQANGFACQEVGDRRRKKDAELESALLQLIEPETAGDPMSEQKWVRSSLGHVCQRLGNLGHRISPPTLARLLRQWGYSLRVNVKKQEASSAHPDRNTQFESIQAPRAHFQAAHWPIVSIDIKKKELIGNVKNAGRTWKEQPEAVNVHDFPQDALGKAIPYGIYDVERNCGSVYVGSSADTPECAVAALVRWWEEQPIPMPSKSCFWPTAEKASDAVLVCGSCSCKSTSATSMA